MKNLKIYTGFVSPLTVPEVISNNILPIFIIRQIKGSEIIGQYDGTCLHFPELSPSFDLFRSIRDGLIGREEFEKKYIIEISQINLFDIIKRLEYLAEVSNAKAVILMGYGSDRKKCHRSVLGNLISDMKGDPVKELVV